MRYFICQHQHKGIGLDTALKREGWLPRHRRVDIALFDHSINRMSPEAGRSTIKKFYEEGATILTYPHGATGSWWMDSDIYQKDVRVFANLVLSEGHQHVEGIIQPHLSHHIIGWNYCPIKEFNKNHEIKKILFAPIHASLKGNKLRREAVDANVRVYNSLIRLSDRYKITVRHLNPLGVIGLNYTSKMKFKPSQPDGSYDDIDDADLVIAEGTYMYLSVARGKPTIGINQRIPIRPNHLNDKFEPKNWELYGNYMAYPIDFDDAPLEDLIQMAASEEQTDWKRLFIGSNMDNRKVSILLQKLRKEDILKRRL